MHDAFAIVHYMAARPLEQFQDFTVVAMGGLFDGFYLYRDFFPTWTRGWLLSGATAFAARTLGGRLRRIFEDLYVHPVYRPGADVPRREEYESRAFAGQNLTGLSYDDFVRHSAKETLSSLIAVQREIEENNRLFLILPEGRYCHDGGVVEFRDFVGVVSFRKQRPLVLGGLSYDELCPGRLGRIDAWIHTKPPLAPPASKAEVSAFLLQARIRLQEATPLLASHAIAAALRRQLDGEWFAQADLENEAKNWMLRFVDSGLPHDPELRDEAWREERIRRFYAGPGRKWIEQDGARLRLRLPRVEDFNRGERTVNDILWNTNCVRHFVDGC